MATEAPILKKASILSRDADDKIWIAGDEVSIKVDADQFSNSYSLGEEAQHITFDPLSGTGLVVTKEKVYTFDPKSPEETNVINIGGTDSIQQISWYSGVPNSIVALTTNGDLNLFSLDGSKLASMAIPNARVFSTGPSLSVLGKLSVLVLSESNTLTLVQPFVPSDYVLSENDYSIIQKELAEKQTSKFVSLMDKVDSGYVPSKSLGGVFLPTSFKLAHGIKSSINDIQWSNDGVYCLTSDGYVYLLTIKSLPSPVDQPKLIPSSIRSHYPIDEVDSLISSNEVYAKGVNRIVLLGPLSYALISDSPDIMGFVTSPFTFLKSDGTLVADNNVVEEEIAKVNDMSLSEAQQKAKSLLDNRIQERIKALKERGQKLQNRETGIIYNIRHLYTSVNSLTTSDIATLSSIESQLLALNDKIEELKATHPGGHTLSNKEEQWLRELKTIEVRVNQYISDYNANRRIAETFDGSIVDKLKKIKDRIGDIEEKKRNLN